MKVEGTTIGITGIGGFIGFQMALRSLSLGMKVKGMDSSPVGLTPLLKQVSAHPQAQNFLGAFVGDITDPKDASRLCENCDIIFHAAAIVTEQSTFELSRKVNVEGTVVMAQAAKTHGAKRFIHFSSVMVYGFTYPKYVKEDGPKRGENDPYCQTKIESEVEVMKFHRPQDAGGMEVIIIRPGDVYGPRSAPWVLRPLSLMKEGRFMLTDGGRGCINHVHIDNLLDGVFLTLENDKATGEAWVFTDGCATTWMEYFTRLAEAAKVPKPRALPFYVLLFIIYVVRFVAGIFRIPVSMHPAALYFISRPHPYSIEKAKTRLGYVPKVTLDQGMEEIRKSLQQ